MSGPEVIGVVASASQLVQYVVEIIDYTVKVSQFFKRLPCPFQQHKDHLETLILTVSTIGQTPFLQTHLIKAHLEALLNRTEILCSTLRDYTTVIPQNSLSKIWAALRAYRAEGQILRDLASLERDKSNLLLCLTSSYGIVLHNIKEQTMPTPAASRDTMPFGREVAEKGTLKILTCLSSKVPANTPLGNQRMKESEKPYLVQSRDQGYGPTRPGYDGDRTREFRQRPSSTQSPDQADDRYSRLHESKTIRDYASTQTNAESVKYGKLTGHVFIGNNSTNKGSVVNRESGVDDNKRRRDLYVENCAHGDGSATLNGPASDELIKSILRRNG